MSLLKFANSAFLAVIVFQRKPEKMDVATETERIYEYFPVVNFTSSVSAASTAGTTKALAPATTRAPSTTHSTMTTVATETTSGSTTETTTETTTATISETMTITTIANTPTSTTPKCHKGGPLTPCDVDDSIDQPKTYRLTSPGYATGHYNSNICHRTCIIANACFLRINAISFKMEPRNPSGECNDYFEFFNEGNGAPGSQVHTGPVCGSESIPADGGQGGRLQFVFHSNDVIEEAGYDLELVFTQGPDPQVDGTCGTIGPG
ncbi:uncharacterized protein LOC135391867 isoform X2 [Ornithodoros turicata]|uniref:uncharacterized protein LOC135391867 isoform X2 n=1 Tax=Ornithodoros turicata TaxID=34597 RepID=UPI003139B14F